MSGSGLIGAVCEPVGVIYVLTSLPLDVQAGMDIYQYKFSHYSLDIAMIFVLGLVVRIAAYLCLELMYRSKRK